MGGFITNGAKSRNNLEEHPGFTATHAQKSGLTRGLQMEADVLTLASGTLQMRKPILAS